MGDGPFRRAELVATGMTDRRIARAVEAGELIRLPEGVYCGPGLAAEVRAAVMLGGRLACVSELRRRGVWAIASPAHVHFTREAARGASGEVPHLNRLVGTPSPGSVDVVDALLQVTKCLPRLHAIAAIDSARHLHLVGRRELGLLASRSRRARRYIAASDPAAESGLETFARVIAGDLGLCVRSQVVFDGIGRVDLLIEEAVVVEADGDAFHTDAAARRRDRRRDAALTARGHPVLRFGFDQLVGSPDEVAAAMIRAVRLHRGVKRGGQIAGRATKRAQNVGLSPNLDGSRDQTLTRAAAAVHRAPG